MMFVKYTIKSNPFGIVTRFEPVSLVTADKFAEGLINGELPGKTVLEMSLVDKTKEKVIKLYDLQFLRTMRQKRLEKLQMKKKMRRRL